MAPPEIQETVGQPPLFGNRLFRKDAQRQNFAGPEDLNAADNLDFNFSGWKLGVDVSLTTGNNGAGNAENRLFPHAAERLKRLIAWTHNELDDAIVITKIDEDDAAEVSAVVEPSGDSNFATNVALPEVTAGV